MCVCLWHIYIGELCLYVCLRHSIALFCLLLLPVWIILAVSLWRCQTLLNIARQYEIEVRQNVLCRASTSCHAILLASCGELSRLLPLLFVLLLLLLLLFLLNDCVFCVYSFSFCWRVCACYYVESNSIRYSWILALLAYNFTLTCQAMPSHAMPCHSMPCHITSHQHIHTHRHAYSEHNVQDVYADYNQTNLLYYYSYAIYYIHCVCVCVYVWV